MLHQGIALRTPLSFGLANVAVGVVVLAAAVALGARIGAGTVANAVLVGLFVDVLESVDAVDGLSGLPLVARVGLLAVGVAATGVGSALYIGAALGAGPRDSLMLVGSRRARRRVGVVRTVIELTALVLGWLLGGTVGVGTVLFALGIGPAVQVAFSVLRQTPVAPPRPAPVGAAA